MPTLNGCENEDAGDENEKGERAGDGNEKAV